MDHRAETRARIKRILRNMASFLDWYLNDMERVDPAVKRELRRSLEDNDPSLDRLAISTFKYDDFDDFTYVPINDEWQKDGIALGKHTHVKKMWFRLPDDLEEEKLRAFCAGMATNKSVEHLDVSWKTNGADLIRMLTPFFSKSGKLCSLRFHGWAKDSRNPARVGTSDGFDDEDILSLAAALGNNRTLKKLQLHRCLKRLSTVGWNAIASILRNSHSGLETLLLGGNGSMGNQALMTFADALSCNKKLDAMYIDVSVSDIDDEPPIPIVYDWEPLAMVLCNRTSIAATFNSNHTLQRLTRKGCRYYSSEEWRLPSDLRNSLIINRENGPVEAARRKILDVHFGGEFSMDPFLEMDLKVVPRLVSWMARDDHGSTLLFQYVRRSACLFERTTPSLEMQSAKRMKFAYV
ncbi:hypothetical protein ACHAXT_010509 [Thalassiosira profunda]